MVERKGPTLVFDLETQRLVHEVGGWANAAQLGLAAAVTLEAGSGAIRRYTEKEVQPLIESLTSAERVIGCNLLGFDYAVLAPYGFAPSGVDTLDLTDHLARILGVHLALENLVSATLGEHKAADGLAAVTWYRQGQIEKVLDYCEQDVRVTHRLWEHGRRNKVVRYRDASFRLREVHVSW